MSVWVGGGPSPLDEMSLVPPYDAMGGDTVSSRNGIKTRPKQTEPS